MENKDRDVQARLRDGPISIDAIHRGAYFSWSQVGVGFGQLSFDVKKNGSVSCMNEMMDREWIRKALYALADHVADNAVLDYEPDERNEAVDPTRKEPTDG